MPGWPGYLRTGDFFPPSESIITDSVVGAKKDADAERRLHMERRVDLFQDDHRELVYRMMGMWFELENFSEIFKVLDLSNNVCKKIITSISNLYDEAPKWKLAKDDGGAWDLVRRQSNHTLVMPLVNAYTNLCNECVVRVACIGGRIRYHVITPDLVKVWQNDEDPTTIDALAYMQANVDTPSRLPIWHYWSNGGSGAPDANEGPVNKVLDATGDPADARSVKFTVPNPYTHEDGTPLLPFVTYHKSYPLSKFFDQTTGEDIVQGSLMVCVMESLVNHMFRCDSAAIKYIKGEVEQTSGQIAGLLRFLSIRPTGDQPVDVGQLAAQGDWAGIRQVLNDKIGNLANNYGLSIGALEIQGTPASGFALKVRKEPLLELRRRQIPLYEATDRELYGVTADVWNYERKNVSGKTEDLGTAALGRPLLPLSEADPKVTYSHVHEPMTAQEKETELEIKQVRLSMGFTNVVELYKEEHPDLSDAEAEVAIRNNNEVNKRLAGNAMLVIGRAQVLPLTQDAAAVTAEPTTPIPVPPESDTTKP